MKPDPPSAARGGFVTLLGQGGRLSIQFAGVLILSRLLTPDDFGLIAMVAVFVGLGELVRDFGMPTAALQARSLSNAQASNFFWANTLLGLAAALVIAASTPFIVALYHEDALWSIVPCLAVAPLLNGAQAQIQVRLARELRFKAIAVTDVLSQTIGLVVAVLAALNGWGYWALVWQILTIALTLLLFRWIVCGWIPALPQRRVGSRAQFGSGGHFGLAQLMTYAASNADSLTIGARFGADSAGYYNRAFQLLVVPISGLLSPLTQVVVPTARRIQSAGRSAFPMLLRVQFLLGAATVWVFVVAAASADISLPLLLGDKWAPSIPLFQILAIGGCVQTLSFVSYWAFIVSDHSRQLLYYNLVSKPIAVTLVLLGSNFGLSGVAWGYTLGLVVSWPLNLIWLARVAAQPSARFFRSGVHVLMSGAVAFAFGRIALLATAPWPVWASLAGVVSIASVAFCLGLAVTKSGRKQLATVPTTIRSIARGQ